MRSEPYNLENRQDVLELPKPIVVGYAKKDVKYKAVDLFAGIGGIRLGFEQAFGKEMDTCFVREWARLHGFPDSYKLSLADTHLYKQLGNSVTVPVIREVAKQIRLILETAKN